ncbi:hypothetical protein DCAR_0102750 [Daucus carota subsp. sativus]|uniref:Uncharacterized protein n=1 Tax=Daucus carota subsp. sativus TaxID=79200 RepID=A0A166H978_DAUCS|nr:PREDICTED: acylsugar acyltransferase 3-like [Daucus carota subsp. sativus]XP_017240756.1 PREDICTED: acylsugar acyltransferase 3-like [Daucus carota subsp. sativus]WOG83573.1 hypothetical protein DCAR_0102750 [Daucus carota subsp. sativus]
MTIRRLIRSSIFRRHLHVISRTKATIKPASPTPLNLKQYNLPLYDCIAPNYYVPMLFFYPNQNSDHGTQQPSPNMTATTISNQLKNSLSETLSKYYPLAGRLTSETQVDCSDQGADFVEVQIGCKLSEIQGNNIVKGDKFSGHLFPPNSIWDEVPNQDSSLVRVQLNHFDCGGIAIAASVSHKLSDALTVCSFLRYWANVSRHSGDHPKLLDLCPQFQYDLMPKSCYDDSVTTKIVCPPKHWITKEIVFHNKNIETLKATARLKDKLDGVVEDQKYTRNELVTALLYKCSVAAAAATSKSGEYAPSVLFQTVNMRRMMEPKVPETSVGNIVTPIHIPTTTESETMLNNLIRKMRQAKMQLRGIKNPNEFELIPVKLEEYVKSNHRVVAVSSMCNFPIYKEMDFGWGRPARVSLVDTPVSDLFTLMDTASGDGIKAVISLEEKYLEHFQNNQELLTYGCFL